MLTIEKIAIELADGLEIYDFKDKFNELKRGLELIVERENITLEQLREQCWEDSTAVFEKIYG